MQNPKCLMEFDTLHLSIFFTMKEICAFKTTMLKHGLKRRVKLRFKLKRLKRLKRSLQKSASSAGAFQNAFTQCFQWSLSMETSPLKPLSFSFISFCKRSMGPTRCGLKSLSWL